MRPTVSELNLLDRIYGWLPPLDCPRCGEERHRRAPVMERRDDAGTEYYSCPECGATWAVAR